MVDEKKELLIHPMFAESSNTMGRQFSVKLTLAALVAFMPVRAEDLPNAVELLRASRMAESAQEWQLKGDIRLGSVRTPIRLTMSQGTIRYDFLDNGDSITLKLGDKGSTLEEKRGGKSVKVRNEAQVRGTDMRYEDLALRFLYWKDAKVLGDEMAEGAKCWKIEARPPKGESQYSRVLLWVGKDSGALMRAESYDANNKWARRFRVVGVMKEKGYWLLKKMSVESADGVKGEDPQPTYLEIKDVEKGPQG
jgi:hypothetical protein